MTDRSAPVTVPVPARAERWLVWFMRILALPFLARGLLNWLVVLGAPGFPSFIDMSTAQQVLTGYSAVIMVAAGVGLWLGASWGTVIWLMAALSEVVAFVAFRDLFGTAWPVVGFHIAAMSIYVIIAWRITQVREE
jgi:hypothetical protein